MIMISFTGILAQHFGDRRELGFRVTRMTSIYSRILPSMILSTLLTPVPDYGMIHRRQLTWLWEPTDKGDRLTVPL